MMMTTTSNSMSEKPAAAPGRLFAALHTLDDMPFAEPSTGHHEQALCPRGLRAFPRLSAHFALLCAGFAQQRFPRLAKRADPPLCVLLRA
jgi:hypothetical protein